LLRARAFKNVENGHPATSRKALIDMRLPIDFVTAKRTRRAL
jgi:hypothetical protein